MSSFSDDSVLQQSLKHMILDHMHMSQRPSASIVLLHDTDPCPLAQRIVTAYQAVLSQLPFPVTFIAVSQETKVAVYDAIRQWQDGDLAILVQNTSFRLDDFRFRLVLFRQGFWVIEQSHLARNLPEEADQYCQSLIHDATHYKQVFDMLSSRFASADRFVIRSSQGDECVVTGGFEPCLANTGIFPADQGPQGARYPIGEMFTEAKDLQQLSGVARVTAYPHPTDHTTLWPQESFPVVFEKGLLVSHSGPQSFEDLLDLIRTENPDRKVWVRELGFGLNRAITDRLTDVGSYERRQGFHVSLGLKHTMYRKKFPKEVNQRFHIDIFFDTENLEIDGVRVFSRQDGFLLS